MTSPPMKPEEEDFLRLVRIILRDIPSKLRGLFRSEFATKYGRSYADDAVSGQFFLSKVTGRFNVAQAEIQNGDSADFDCTTLCYCLLNPGAGLLPPMRSTNARVAPFNSSELVNQLREQRNLVAHSSKAEVTKLDFIRGVIKLREIYAKLGWMDTDLVNYANAPIDTAECRRLREDLSEERKRNQGSKCLPWTYVGLLSVVTLIIAVFLYGHLVELDGRLQDFDRRLGEDQRQLMEHDGRLQDHDHRLGEDQRQLVEHGGRLQDHNRSLSEVQGDVRDNKEHIESLDHRVQGVEMTSIVLLRIGAIIAVLVIVTTVWWMCCQQKDNPSPPRNLQVVKVCTDYVCVKWQAPVSDGNSPITCYVVDKADASTRTFTNAGHTNSDTCKFKVSQLNKGKPYLIRVIAENAIGQSEPVSLQEPVRLPLESSPPRNLQVVKVCTDYICVTWQAPVSDGNSPITRYFVEKADANARTFTVAGDTNSDTLEFKVSQLNKGKQYLIRVFAKNAIGQSEPVYLQGPVRLPLEPSPPRNLQMVKVCTDYVCVTWQVPVSDGNSPITRYVVEKADASTRTFTIAGHTDSDTQEFKVSQLNKGKQYLIRVFAENVIGRSEPVSLQEPVELLLEKLKKELRKMYNRLTVPVQDTVDAECCSEVPLDEMFVELRLQESTTTTLPESLSYRDVEEMQRSMQSSKPIETSQLFDQLHDRCAPRKVLMLGKAGIGKTTLIKQIASQWAKKELWKHVEYLFVITLRQLRQDRKLTLGDLLLDGLSLTKEEKIATLNHLRENASTVMIVAEGWDEIKYNGKEGIERDDTKEVELNTILSSILNNVMLPGAKVLLTSRPNNNSPVCERTAELYGFTQASIYKYVHKFSGQDTELEQFIKRYLESNVNIETMCYVPVHTNFVCACLKDMRSSSCSDDTSTVNTMTQLYTFAVTNLARKLHPSLKGSETEIDEKKFLTMVGDSLKNHAELAKHCTLSTPLRIIMYEEDLDLFHISDKDKHTGFLVQSVTGNRNPSLRRRCWFFHHLTMQEVFAAVGLLRGPHEALLGLIENKTSVSQHEVLIRFVVGLSYDRHNAHFMECLEAAQDKLDPRTFIEKLAPVFDPLQLLTTIYETQRPDLADLVPRKIKSNNVFPTEMMALSWGLQQQECPVISLNLSGSTLDVHLVRQLCNGLTKNTSLKSLNLDNCSLSGEGSAALAAALGHLTRLTELRLGSNNFDDPTSGQALADSVSQMTYLQTLKLEWCHINDVTAFNIAVRASKLPGLRILVLEGNHISRLGQERVKEITWGRVRRVELDLQEPPSEEDCGSRCDGGLWQSV